jgi:perosamine synthetase
MTTGEGGMLTTDDDELAEKVRLLRGHGNPTTTWEREGKKMPWKRDCVLPGYNFRMSNILAAIGVVQLKKLDKMNEMRRKLAKYYDKNLDFDEIDKPVELKECKHVYQMYTIKVKGIDRDEFVLKLREKGIGASVHFDPPVHLTSYYRERYKVSLPITERVSRTIVTLPLYPGMTHEEQDRVIQAIEETIKELKRI